MATRYWVPAAGSSTGTWDASTTTNWSTSSGGLGGASAPTSADDVVFDALSAVLSPFTVTLGTSAACGSMTASALTQVMTLAWGTTGLLTCSGSMSWPASSFAVSGAGGAIGTTGIVFAATSGSWTFTTNGVTVLCPVQFGGAGSTVTLGSALTSTNAQATAVNVTGGTFDTGGFSLTAVSFGTSGSTTRVINLNASTLTLSASTATVFNMASTTGLTFNAGTSQITLTGGSLSFVGGGLTFNNVTIAANSGNKAYTGANTFNNLTINQQGSPGGLNINTFSANQIITGTLTFANTSGTGRLLICSSVIGTQRTLSAATLAVMADVDFRDIVAAGASGTWSGTRIGDCKNNSNITFTPGATKYWNLAAGGSWMGTAWALTSGGAVSVNNYPLAQDNVVISDTGLNSGATITANGSYQIAPVDMSSRTLPMTFTNSAGTPFMYGGVTLSSAVAIVGTGALTFVGQGVTSTITSAGVSWTQPITINCPTGTVQLGDNWTTGAVAVALTAGTLNLNGHTLSAATFVNTSTATRTLAGGSNGAFTLTGSGASAFNSVSTGLSISGTFNLNMISASAKTFAGGSFVYTGMNLVQGGAGALTISGSNTFNDIQNTTQPATITFTAGTTTTVSAFSASGTAGNLITLNTTGAFATLSKASGTVNASYLSITNSHAIGGATWNAASSTDGGGNTGWNFNAANSNSPFPLLGVA